MKFEKNIQNQCFIFQKIRINMGKVIISYVYQCIRMSIPKGQKK